MPERPIQNHYDVLGIERTASPEEVKSAFRLRSHMFHPDKYENYPEPLRSQLKAEAAKEFKKLTLAYETLRDPARRAEHDRELDRLATVRWEARAGKGGAAGRRARRAGSGAATEPGARPRASARRPVAEEQPRPRERDPLLVVRPERLDFGTLLAGSTKQLPLKIANAGGRTLFGEITANRAWLSVSRRSFVSSSTVVFVSVDTSGLLPGEEYAGSLIVTTLNGGDQVVPVALRVAARPEPVLAGVPPVLDLGAARAGSTKARTIKLANAGTGTLIGSIAVRAPWLAVSETHFRGNDIAFEIIATTAGLDPGAHQGQVLIFSNGGQATIDVRLEVEALATGGTIGGVGAEDEGRATSDERQRAKDEGRATSDERQRAKDEGRATSDEEGMEDRGWRTQARSPAGAEERRPPSGTRLSKEVQHELLRRILQIEPETIWERDLLRRLAQLVRAGERLAPGELAKIYELEARMAGRSSQAAT